MAGPPTSLEWGERPVFVPGCRGSSCPRCDAGRCGPMDPGMAMGTIAPGQSVGHANRTRVTEARRATITGRASTAPPPTIFWRDVWDEMGYFDATSGSE